ncbi:TAXI family TRAP transporter solute-binding subunit [Nakamurella silvestris]|nr:TAXI family TRAP transporter solute-binding subunit [Nakamurella silvestris]
MMRTVRLLLILAVALTALLPAGCAGRSAPTDQVIATGGTKGVYYSYGVQLAEMAARHSESLTLTVAETSGSVSNLRMLAEGRAQFAIVAADAVADAVAGRDQFDRPVDIRAVARIYDDYIQLVTRRDSSIEQIMDLPGHRLSLGPEGSGTDVVANRILEAAGFDAAAITNVPLGINESVEALRAREIDAFFWQGGLPTSGVVELADEVDIRLVPLGELAEPLRQAYGPVYRLGTVPSGTYGIDTEVQTVAVPDYLVAAASVDEDTVFEMTRLLFTHRSDMARHVSAVSALSVQNAIFTEPVGLHPGALRYYRENKP